MCIEKKCKKLDKMKIKNIFFLKNALIAILMLAFHFAVSQVVIHIEGLAENTPENASIYFAGNINGWNPGDPEFQLEIRNDGDYWIDLPGGSGKVEYKFTRGSWDKVESNGNGGFRPNRTFTYGTVDTLQLSILGWEDLDGGGSNSTANQQVQILDDAMYMPQLGRNRRIWVYLPQDYDTTLKSYPVLYMQDGQNVFDAQTSFAGEWEVDESLCELENEGFRGVIVVAIDNGGSHRIDEYSPFVNTQYGGGEGDAYLDFIITTLKPRIDSTFRILEEPQFTGIMGSSMGGLIAHYAHFRHPDVFGRVGVFSPSYWFSEEYYSYTEEVGKTDSARIYLYTGSKETTIANSTTLMFEQLLEMGYTEEELTFYIDPNGQHAEQYWALHFPDAVQWLFEDDETLISGKDDFPYFSLYPNPVVDKLVCEGPGEMEVKVYDLKGNLLMEKTIIDKGVIELKENAQSGAGVYWVQEIKEGKRSFEKVILFR
jgi:predicted alpha/beta superfamily hydrolase